MSDIKISVIIPVYNQEKYIQRCIDSVICQSLKNIEILVIDDGSVDKTRTILEYYKSAVRVISTSKKGPGGARNIGFDIASGEYIFLLDSDDWISQKNALETLYFFAFNNNLDVLIFDYLEVNALGKIKEINLNRFEYNKLIGGQDILLLFLSGKVSRFPWDKLYRRSLIEEYSFRFPEKVWFEDIYQIVLLKRAERVMKINLKPYSYWTGDMSITRSFSDRIFDKEKVCLMTVDKLDVCFVKNNYELIEYFLLSSIVMQNVFAACINGSLLDLKMILKHMGGLNYLIQYRKTYLNNRYLLWKDKIYIYLMFHNYFRVLWMKKILLWLKLKY